MTGGMSKQTVDPQDRGTAPQGPNAPLNTNETSHGVDHAFGFGQDHHSAHSTTHSGIYGADIQITDANGQAASGIDANTIRQWVASTVTTDQVAANSGALDNSFDATKATTKLNAQVEVTQAFDKSRQEFKNDLHNQADALLDEAKAIRAKNGGKDTEESRALTEQAGKKTALANYTDLVATAASLGTDNLGHLLAGEIATGANDVYRTARRNAVNNEINLTP